MNTTNPITKRQLTKKQKIFGAVGSVAAVLALWFIIDYVLFVSTDNAQIEAHAVFLAPRVSGYIVSVKASEGSVVKKDQILAEIDDRDYQNALKQKQAELSSVEARKEEADKNFKRISTLFSSGAVSRQQFDQTSTQLAELKSSFESLSAQVGQAQINLENTKIKAPTDGVIVRRSAEIGQLAAPGAPIFGFVDSGERWVTANFKETDISSIRVGSYAKIEVDAFSGRGYEGTVESVAAATGATFTLIPPDNATGNFTKIVQRIPVKIKFNSLSEKDIRDLSAGLSAYVKVRKH